MVVCFWYLYYGSPPMGMSMGMGHVSQGVCGCRGVVRVGDGGMVGWWDGLADRLGWRGESGGGGGAVGRPT